MNSGIGRQGFVAVAHSQNVSVGEYETPNDLANRFIVMTIMMVIRAAFGRIRKCAATG